jgi:hypothetical protein
MIQGWLKRAAGQNLINHVIHQDACRPMGILVNTISAVRLIPASMNTLYPKGLGFPHIYLLDYLKKELSLKVVLLNSFAEYKAIRY